MGVPMAEERIAADNTKSIAISLPLPADWPKKPSGNTISTPKNVTLLPVGSAYATHARRILLNRTLAEDIELEAKLLAELSRASSAGGSDHDLLGLGLDTIGDEEEDDELLARDPKEWKDQDHYAVLGLAAYRYKATDEQIKVAHRRKVLRHHPDKKAGQAGDANDDGFFKCIQKAMEVLTNPERRRQFDSVDPHYVAMEQAIPAPATLSKIIAKDPAEFFEIFGSAFELEARFSKQPQVPMLGEMDDSKQKVEEFYDFWYKFDSWRSFEYLDKEVNEGSDSRDDKRYTEKKNKSERARRKKEDNARLRTLVDLALGLDPRIKRIKQEEKEARSAKKNQRVNGVHGSKQAQLEEQKRKEEEAKQKEEADKIAKAEAKKAKAAAANAAKKARRAQRMNEDANGTAA